MWTRSRPTLTTRIFTIRLVASLVLGLVLTGRASAADGAEDRAAGAAGGQGSRDNGGPGRATVSPPSAGRDGPSSPAAPSGAGAVAGQEPAKYSCRGMTTVAESRDIDLSPANAVSAT
jgi:hypothetical protein